MMKWINGIKVLKNGIQDKLRKHREELKKKQHDKDVEKLQQLAGIKQATEKQWTDYYKDIEKQVNKMANKQIKRSIK